MIDYLQKHGDKVAALLTEHLQIVFFSVALAFALAMSLVILIYRFKFLYPIVINFFNICFSVPSLVLFTFLVPISGLGIKSAVIATVVYNLCVLTKNILAGFDSVDRAIVEAARGMGMTRKQTFLAVEFPLALPIIITGVKLAFIMSVSLVVLAATIGAGGMGALLFDGMRTKNWNKVIIGVIAVTVMVFIFNFIFSIFEKIAQKRAAGA
ncbi:MAG: ABC transporter permease [Clostridiales Family XIII bacterium]|jgi:osmoprotectant transport system permease protein|nr:ABC transporter permease [Clostridiales Family XIII bacterium]